MKEEMMEEYREGYVEPPMFPGVQQKLFNECLTCIVAFDAASNPEIETCEHGVKDGDWCEPCNKAEKEARMDPENNPPEHICVGGSAADEAAGMAWWNGLNQVERRAALLAVGKNTSVSEAYQWNLLHGGSDGKPRGQLIGGGPLTCANCGEDSTNPGQFTPDGLWICTEVCRRELATKRSYDDLAESGGIVDAP
jgi:hypothetical protein